MVNRTIQILDATLQGARRGIINLDSVQTWVLIELIAVIWKFHEFDPMYITPEGVCAWW